MIRPQCEGKNCERKADYIVTELPSGKQHPMCYIHDCIYHYAMTGDPKQNQTLHLAKAYGMIKFRKEHQEQTTETQFGLTVIRMNQYRMINTGLRICGGATSRDDL